MYKIAICDDEKSSAAEAAELLEKYKTAHPRLEMSADIFYTSLDLLDAIEKTSYDIYLLDIYIDKLNGIEIAQSIRKKDENGQIIFMTSSNAFYKEAFRIHAVHYLEKPILKEDFFDAMDRVCQEQEVRFLVVRESGEVRRIPIDDIIYVESEDHYKRIVTDAKTYFVRSTMQTIMEDIGEDYFHALGMKTIVNLKRVLKINKDTLSMEDGAEFSVPRGTYRQLSELILKYTF
ncbi:LytR/AlgR family response regulator transcription factor [Butyrivibrio sp. VCB2006]|uniref:LytR/AlgR family response regulator transcription factor n=1 Tax=Butyrivibrio sp. VCB2006 TaxID=1280679 RepID=UPI00041E201F|nr:LytTR family DNA-binding domain-containing protein [Butyrivibrio sp. VCB2006]